jgi:hypothetical protein
MMLRDDKGRFVKGNYFTKEEVEQREKCWRDNITSLETQVKERSAQVSNARNDLKIQQDHYVMLLDAKSKSYSLIVDELHLKKEKHSRDLVYTIIASITIGVLAGVIIESIFGFFR